MSVNIGEKIKRLRTGRGLTQEELAARCDLSKGFISQLERDLTSPSIATLVDILESLGTDLGGFFNEREEEKIAFAPRDVFERRDDERGISIRWLIPNAQKNAMEPILLELDPGGATDWDDPHQGEEFGLVLAGSVVIELGEKKHRARRDCAFAFQPTAPHRIVNAGKAMARVVWVSSPPSF